MAMALPAAAGAAPIEYAPVDRPGPALSIPQSELDSSLDCGAGLDSAAKTPVLLVHGTGSDPENNFSWNWIPALEALGTPWCTVALVDSGQADVQASGEHVVNAIRTMFQRSGRKISILGHSQGGMIPRWALRFWPDTRAMVDDVVGFAPSNHGTLTAQLSCASGCSAAGWQQRSDSQFIDALNSVQETFAGISYTSIYTKTDVVVTPNLDADSGSSSLRTGDGERTNVAIQDVCPDPADHLAIGTTSNTAYALAIDALDNAGPADPSRLDPVAVCSRPFQPGVDPSTALADAAAAAADLANSYGTAESLDAEPALRCYVLAEGCTAGAPDTTSKPTKAKPKKKKKKKKRKKRKKKRKQRR